MAKLEQLYAEPQRLKEQKVTGSAAAQARHRQIGQLQKEIDYFELGDMISRRKIQEELAEIQALQEEISRLTAEVDCKKRKLKNFVFGEHTTIQLQ